MFQPIPNETSLDEEIIVDFAEVAVLTPSWADEFLTPLYIQRGKKVRLINTENASVKASLAILGR